MPLLTLAFSIKEVKVLSRRRERTLAFVERHKVTFGGNISVARVPQQVVIGSDLVITLTESREPLVQPGWLEREAVLCSMGSYIEVLYGGAHRSGSLNH